MPFPYPFPIEFGVWPTIAVVINDEIQDIQKAVYFYLSDEIVIQRLMNRGKDSGRADDNIEIIENRIEVYKEQTQPLIDYYKKKDLLLEIDASPTIEEIFEKVGVKLELP